MTAGPVLQVDGLSKKYAKGLAGARRTAVREIAREIAWWRGGNASRLRGEEFWALRDISFTLHPGDSLGVIGANGAGKSTLLKVLCGLLKPDSGSVRVSGRIGALIELGAGFNPVLTGRENVYAQGALHGYGTRRMHARFDAIAEFADLGDGLEQPVKHYSSGMRARLGFAVAVHLDPQLLLVDEVLAVGDLAFQIKCMRFMQDYRQRGGTLVFVGHAGHQVQAACDRGIVLTQGDCTFDGPVVEALDAYFRQQRPEQVIPVGMGAGSASPALDLSRVAAAGVAIDRVEFSSNGAAPRNGSPASLTVEYTTTDAHPDALIFCAFYSVDGQRCIAGSAIDVPGGLAKGAGRTRANFASLALAEGGYQLRVALIDRALGYPVALRGWFDAPVRVTVSQDASIAANFGRMIDMPVLFPAQADEC